MPAVVCKNCDSSYEGNFCPNCGQSAKEEKIRFKHILLQAIEIEKRFFSTISNLTLRPGVSIRDYINGKRSVLFSPGKFLVITGAIATIIVFKFGLFALNDGNDATDLSRPGFMLDALPDREGYYAFSTKFYTLVNVVGVVIYTFITYWVFKPHKYNLVEIFVLNLYIASFQFIVLIVMAPIIIISGSPALVDIFNILTGIVNIWILLKFFEHKFLSIAIRAVMVLSVSFIIAYFANWIVYLLIPSELLNTIDSYL